jgi:hypothetical protein
VNGVSLHIRSVVVASALNGMGETAWTALTPEEAAQANGVYQRIRAYGQRADIAKAIVRERQNLEAVSPEIVSVVLGAKLYAGWIREMDTRSKETFVRGLSESDLVAIGALRSVTLPEGTGSISGWLIAQGVAALRRVASVREATELLLFLCGERELSSPSVIQWERALRVFGRKSLCVTLAKTLNETPTL